MIRLDPLRDAQEEESIVLCARCGRQLHWEAGEICEKCKEELETWEEN